MQVFPLAVLGYRSACVARLDRRPDRMRIPASHGVAVKVKGGDALKLINLHGQQVLDTWAFSADDLDEYMSMAHTRSRNSRIYVGRGDALVEQSSPHHTDDRRRHLAGAPRHPALLLQYVDLSRARGDP